MADRSTPVDFSRELLLAYDPTYAPAVGGAQAAKRRPEVYEDFSVGVRRFLAEFAPAGGAQPPPVDVLGGADFGGADGDADGDTDGDAGGDTDGDEREGGGALALALPAGQPAEGTELSEFVEEVAPAATTNIGEFVVERGEAAPLGPAGGGPREACTDSALFEAVAIEGE